MFACISNDRLNLMCELICNIPEWGEDSVMLSMIGNLTLCLFEGEYEPNISYMVVIPVKPDIKRSLSRMQYTSI